MTNNRHFWRVFRPYDRTKPVYVYKNLRDKAWSVRQGNKVVIHTTKIILSDVTFKVNPKGKERVRQTRQKNVHAFIVGKICSAIDVRKDNVLYPLGDDECFDYALVTYNPYQDDTFVERSTGIPVLTADYCDMDIYDMDPVIAIWKQLELIEVMP